MSIDHYLPLDYTTYEFFKSPLISTAFKVDPLLLEDPHGFAASICAVYLQLSNYAQQKITGQGSLMGLEGQYPFVRYAWVNLGEHASQSSHQKAKIPDTVSRFLCRGAKVPLVWQNSGKSQREIMNLTWELISTLVHFMDLDHWQQCRHPTVMNYRRMDTRLSCLHA